MKKVIALLLAAVLIFGGYRKIHAQSFESQAKSASGAIFENGPKGRRFFCSGTEIGSTDDGGGIFLTARHCVTNIRTNEVKEHLSVSFSDNQGGPFYDAVPIYISLTDDLALLYLRDGGNIPSVDIRDERNLRAGNPIFNVSFPLGTGKSIFHGEYMASVFPFFPEEFNNFPFWKNSMPINMTIAPGSSGSGVFSQKDKALIAIAVGTFGEGSYNIAIPADRVIDFLNDLHDNTVEKFKYAYPPIDDLFEKLFEKFGDSVGS